VSRLIRARGYVDTDEMIFRIEQEAGQCLAQLSLATPVGPKNKNEP